MLAGDALGMAYAAHHSAILGYLVRRLPDAADAEDLAQDVFLRFLPHAATFTATPGAGVQNYLFTIARRLLVDRARGPARRVQAESLETAPADRLHDARTSAELADVEEQLDLALFLAGLVPEQQRLLLLRSGEGRPLAEVAALLGGSVASIQRRHAWACHCLRRVLRQRRWQP